MHQWRRVKKKVEWPRGGGGIGEKGKGCRFGGGWEKALQCAETGRVTAEKNELKKEKETVERKESRG